MQYSWLSLASIGIVLMGLSACGSNQPIHKSAALSTQPAIDANFPDPTVVYAPDGYFYAYGTNTVIDGKLIHIQVARSHDLYDWEILPDALPMPPDWAERDFWAPHVMYDSLQKTYFLYYSGESVDPAMGKCLGVATSKNPAGPFVDKGSPLLCGDAFIEIDPMAFDDPQSGKKYLYWGSGHQPIKVQELADDRLNFREGSQPIPVLDILQGGGPDNYQKLVEGAWVMYKNGFYYLFYSGDNCCGEHAHYALMVARSTDPLGPFETMAESTGVANNLIIERYKQWLAIGHNSIVKDKAAQEWVVYHGIDSLDRPKGRVMLIHPLEWEGGWPVINLDDNNKR